MLRSAFTLSRRTLPGLTKKTSSTTQVALLKTIANAQLPSKPTNISNPSDTEFDKEKTLSGTPSPWAVFDAWGAGDGSVKDKLSESEMSLLSEESVKIPHWNEAKVCVDEDATTVTNILGAYDKLMARRSSVQFGYPYNLMYNHEELYPFMKYSINNLGDPFVTSNYGVHSRQFETSVIDFFAKLWRLPNKGEYWGYVTTCGTEGNLHGMLLARECHPNGVLYSSRETHYSIFKAARYYRMDAKSIPTLPMGEIDYAILEVSCCWLSRRFTKQTKQHYITTQ